MLIKERTVLRHCSGRMIKIDCFLRPEHDVKRLIVAKPQEHRDPEEVLNQDPRGGRSEEEEKSEIF